MTTTNTLDAKTGEFLEGFGQLWNSMAQLSIPEKRAEMHRLFTMPRADMEPVATFTEKTIDGPNGKIPLRIFTPEGEGPFPVMVFFHHGGWVLGSLDECEPVCRKMTNETRSIVIAVDYRLAPEHKYPAPLEDAFAATQWAIENAHTFKGDPSRVGVGGESAGGNLATAVCLMAKEKKSPMPAYQGLFYPMLTCDPNLTAYENNPDKHLITLENMKWFYNQYLNRPEEKKQPLASPIKAQDLSGLPPTLIITAEWDPLRLEAATYAAQLNAQGTHVQHHCYKKVIHGFFGFPIYPEEASAAMAEIKHFLHN